jgi:cytochrome c
MDVNNVAAIDPDSPGRVSVNAVFSSGPLPKANATAALKDDGPLGLRRMKSSDCFNCHAVDQKRVGPPLLDVANKYRNREGSLEASIERVMKGSTGAWGKIPMIPHSHHTVEEVREMVSWIYSLEPSGLVRVFGGFVAEIPVDPKDETSPGYYRLEATYTDRGAGSIPPLSASVVTLLRQRRVEAESADEILGPQVLGSGTAGGGQFVGAINHGHTLRFRDIAMDDVGSVTLRVASAGAGGQIEVRLDQPDGELLATADIEVNGQWEQWYERQVDLTKTSGRHDVIIRFVHPQQVGGLMNLDSIYFHR